MVDGRTREAFPLSRLNFLTAPVCPHSIHFVSKHHSFSSLFAVLTGIAKRLGLDTKLHEFQLRRDWPSIVGEPIASHTRPDQIRFKKLYLIVGNSVWLQQLMFLRPGLIKKINAAAGTELVTELVMRVGDCGQAAKASPVDHEQMEVRPSAEALAQAAAHAEAIQDPDLRASLTAAMATALTAQAGETAKAGASGHSPREASLPASP